MAETVLLSGFIRGKQRYFCKGCKYHFTIHHENRKTNNEIKRKRQTTIIDIAKAIGVSNSTVSRALHDHPDISVQTRSAIKELAKKLDYQPNLLALSFSNRRTHTIGVIIPNLDSNFFASALSGIQHVATQSGYKVMICQSNESHKTEVANVQTLMSNWIEGLIICHTKETETFDHIRLQMQKGIPIIHFGRVCEEMETSRVLHDDIGGSFDITEHLVLQGYKRIAVVAGPKNLSITRRRLAGYLEALKKYNRPFNEQYVAYTDFTKESILGAVDNWLVGKEKPDAIYSMSDRGAIYIMVRLKARKIRIPAQIAVAGFGNDPMDEVIEPNLTSYNPHTFKVGAVAAQLFFDELIAGEDYKPKTRVVKGELIIRASTVRKAN